MKKKILVIVLVLTIVLGLGMTAFAAVRLGDVDGDGRLTAFDAQMIAEYRAGKRNLSDEQKEAAGDLSVQDVVNEVLTEEKEKVYPVVGLLTPVPPDRINAGANPANTMYYTKGEYAVSQNDAAKSVSVELMGITGTPAGIEFYHEGQPIDSDAWVVSMDLNFQINSTQSGIMSFFATEDETNGACFKFAPKADAIGSFVRAIYRDGQRLQEGTSGERVVDLPAGTQWSGKIMMMFYDGVIYFFLQDANGQFLRATSYVVDYEHASPQMEVSRYMNVQLTNIETVVDANEVAKIHNELLMPENCKGEAKLLFLGSSCIFYYDMPDTFARLAKNAGYYVEVCTIARSNARQAMFTDPSDYLYQRLMEELPKGYDAVVFHGHSGDSDSADREAAAIESSNALIDLIREGGSEPVVTARAPVHLKSGTDVCVTNAKKYDVLFGGIAEDKNAAIVYVNRAFALAHQEYPELNLWYTDDAHSNPYGCYLASCVMVASYFNTSCANVGDDFIDAETAAILRDIADRVVLEGELPNW